jgi:peptidoglycan/xylan/chitin deacetylase (PgdA/CDA1 family)
MSIPFVTATGLRRGAAAACSLLAAVSLLGASSTVSVAAFEQTVPVLMYHRITKAPADAALPELWVNPRRFRSQMAALKRSGWRSITAAQLARSMSARRSVGPKRFVITIDDGARDGYWHAAPILERFDFRATYCLTPGRANRPWQLAFWQMRRLSASGHEIANHSLTHADLPALGAAQLRRQVRRAHALITERVGQAPVSLCYPFGHQSPAVRRVVANTGYRIAFTTVYGARHSSAAPLLAPRVRVNGSDRPASLLAKMRPFAHPNVRTTG